MKLFIYKAIDLRGENIRSEIRGRDLEEVIEKIRNKNQTPIEVKEIGDGKDLRALNLINKVSIRDISVFCNQFFVMLNAGVGTEKCMLTLSKQTENKKLRRAIEDVYEDLLKGSSFSQAVEERENVFPNLLINMIKAGETSGKLDQVIRRMANHYENEHQINNKIRSAMVYPLILAVISVVVVIFLLTFIMPVFTEIFLANKVELPKSTQLLLALSAHLKNYWHVNLFTLILLCFSFLKFRKGDKGKKILACIKLKVPLIKTISLKIMVSRFSRTLASLLKSGVSLIESLEITHKLVGNSVVEAKLQGVIEESKKGTSLFLALKNTSIFPPIFVQMVEVGEESGSLEEILEKTANFYDGEVEAGIQKIISLFEPLMIVVMSLIIGFIVISMVMPMFEMMNLVG